MLMLYPLLIWANAKRNGMDLSRTALILSCGILASFFILRAESVGVDTKFYCQAFRQFPSIPFRELFTAKIYVTDKSTWSFDFEPGYRLLNKLLSLVFTDGQTITAANGLLIFAFLYRFIRTRSANWLLSIWLYVLLGVYQTDMNVTRNAIAIFLCYSVVGEIRAGRAVRYFTVVILASLIHQTALLFLPLFFLIRYVRLNRKQALIILAVFLVLGLNSSIFQKQIMAMLPGRYARYFTSGSDKLSAYLVGLFNLMVLAVAWLFLTPRERFVFSVSPEFNEGLWMLVLNLSFFALSFGFSASARAAALFGPYMIAFIPNALDRIQSSERRQFGIVSVAALCFAQYVLRMMVNNIGGTLPYRFFWQ